MYELDDTIVAISSPASGARAIVRITGPDAMEVCNRIFRGPVSVKRGTTDDRQQVTDDGRRVRDERREASLVTGNIAVDAELKVDAKLYLFFAPHSYTGDDIAEIHVYAGPAVTEALIGKLLGRGLGTSKHEKGRLGSPLRMAGPGEFTARAYLNGKIDLAQAEAVNEIITTSNEFQLAAAEKLLSGRLAEATTKVCSTIMDCLSLIEAGLDFGGEDIEFITRPEAVRTLAGIKEQLEQLLCGSISYELLIDLPAVGIAGAPNAGKSSLLNTLLGKVRSIVSHKRKTTRDVLTGLLTLAHCRCVLFDCAGLILKPDNILDELAQQAAIEALRNSTVVVFCVDVSRPKTQDSKPKSRLWTEEIGLWSLVWSLTREPGRGARVPKIIPVATKSDLLSEEVLAKRLGELNELFARTPISCFARSNGGYASAGATDFLVTSVKTGVGIELLRETIDTKVIGPAPHQLHAERGLKSAGMVGLSPADNWCGVALTARHRQALTFAIENVSESIEELKAGNDEVTAMMLRAAYQSISNIEQPHIDEQILERIFGRFCIGK